ncbi:gamma-glutamylcyclotransferase family protein [Pseudoalteromonas sp. SSM20]|uniref:gamma-glutamylcyclotransferase family protein n=1 Tax=Pseudoalteromonas sp. SSM20 TaxID=3139394 RepID=UPI003BAB89DE
MERLFSYGTLQQENVQQANFGRKLEGEKAILTGYCLSEIKINDEQVVKQSGKAYHPILVFTGNSQDEVKGSCFLLTTDELAMADSYEVAEYTRINATTKDGKPCWIYAATNEVVDKL